MGFAFELSGTMGSRVPMWRRYLRGWGPDAARDLDDEIDFHLQQRTEELVEQGWALTQAEAEARRRFGNVEGVRDTCLQIAAERNRSRRRRAFWEDLAQDVVYTARSLWRSPAFSVVSVLTLALGIGATAALFGAFQAVVLRPLPFPHDDRLALVYETWRDGLSHVSAGNFSGWRQRSRSFEALTAVRYESFNLNDDAEPRRLLGALVTHGFFDVFGVAPQLGRVFGPGEDRPGSDGVVVVSHRLWQEAFGGRLDVVGRDLKLNGVPRVVIGVMPADFDLLAWSEVLWVPMAFDSARENNFDEHYLTVYGRLRAGTTLPQAQQDMAAVAVQLQAVAPRHNAERGSRVLGLPERLVGDSRGRLMVLLAAVACVLLIACVNVGKLSLARGTTRARELAVRAALGAGRARLLRQLLTGSLLLATVGTLVGLILAHWTIRALIASAPAGVPRLEQTRIDTTVLAFAAALAVLSCVLFGLIPALRATRTDLQPALRASRSTTGPAGRGWLRQMLLMAEVALALTLLVGAGLLLRTAAHLDTVPPGFDGRGVLTGRVTLPEGLESEALRQSARRLSAALAATPGVASSGLSSQVPLGPGGNSNGLLPADAPFDPALAVDARLRMVTPGYLETLRIRLLRGRLFGDEDRAGSQRVMIVSESLARLLFPGQDSLGQRVVCCEGSPEPELQKLVVGVVADVRSLGPHQDLQPEFYLPLEQVPAPAWNWVQRTLTLAVRGKTGLPQVADLRGAVAAVDPTLPLHDVATFDQRLKRSLAEERFNRTLLVLLGGLGLVLAAVGIYGVTTYLVARRTREIGVRMALGAARRRIVREVLARALLPVCLGIVAGVAGGAAAGMALRSQLHGVSPTDPVTLAAVPILLLGVALLASYLPARRAARVDPAVALTEG